MTDHKEGGEHPPVADLAELPPKALDSSEADMVAGGSIAAKRHETKKALLGNIPR